MHCLALWNVVCSLYFQIQQEQEMLNLALRYMCFDILYFCTKKTDQFYQTLTWSWHFIEFPPEHSVSSGRSFTLYQLSNLDHHLTMSFRFLKNQDTGYIFQFSPCMPNHPHPFVLLSYCAEKVQLIYSPLKIQNLSFASPIMQIYLIPLLP